MLRKTYTMAFAMVMLGIIGWVVTGAQHVTALIPCIFGILYFLFAILGRKETRRMHAMHGAAVIALLGTLATARSIAQAAAWAGGTAPTRPAAVITQMIMCILSIYYLVEAVKSFVAARRVQ